MRGLAIFLASTVAKALFFSDLATQIIRGSYNQRFIVGATQHKLLYNRIPILYDFIKFTQEISVIKPDFRDV